MRIRNTVILQLKKTLHDFFSSNLVKLDLDLVLYPDPHKMNADPQPCCENSKMLSLFLSAPAVIKATKL